jgi:hypothetical protein
MEVGTGQLGILNKQDTTNTELKRVSELSILRQTILQKHVKHSVTSAHTCIVFSGPYVSISCYTVS